MRQPDQKRIMYNGYTTVLTLVIVIFTFDYSACERIYSCLRECIPTRRKKKRKKEKKKRKFIRTRAKNF